MIEGLPDNHTQKAIDDLIAKWQKKLKELDQINSGVPKAEIKAERYEQKNWMIYAKKWCWKW